MERRNSRSQSHPHGSERREERRRSVTDAVRATLIDAFSPSWLTDMMNQIRGGSSQQSSDSHENGNTTNRESRTNLTDTQRLSQSTPALYENGQPRTLDFSPHGTSQGLPLDSRSSDSAQPGPSQGSAQQGNLEFPQPGTSYDISTRTRHQDYALPGTSNGTNSQTRQDYAQPSTSRGTPSGTRQNYAQPSTSSGTPSRSGRQDYAQPTTTRSRPLRPPGTVPPVLEFTSSQLPLNRLTDEKSDSVLAQDDSLSRRSNSSHSTSGCSSMVPPSGGSTEPRQDTKRRRSSGESGMSRGTQTQPASQEHKRARLLESSSAANGSNISTWTERLRQAQQESERRRQQTQQDTPLRNNNPSFKPHLFGSPLGNNPRLEDFHNSLFYPGKTCFGGRNNFREDEYIYSPARPRQRNRQNDRQNERSNRDWPYPTRTVVRPRPRPDTEVSPVTGERSQRIMDLLNKMSTPMSDARRIPVVVPREWTANRRYSEFMATGKRSSSSGTGPPTQGLQRGELASISANRQEAGPSPSRSRERQDQGRPSSPQPGPSGLQDNRAARNQGSGRQQQDSNSRASQQISDDRILVELEATKSRTVLRARRKSSENDEATLNLRTAPTMQINSDGQSAAPVNYSVTVTNDAVGRPRFDFEFSSPITERRGSDNSASPGTSGAFQFSSPIQLGGSQPSPSRGPEPVATSNSESTAKPTAGFSFSTPSALKQGFVGAGTDSNFKPASTLNQGSICSTGMGFKTADKLKQGSVMDVLGNSGSGFSFKPAGTSEQKTVMSVLNSSGPGYKPSAKLKQGSVMDVLGNSGSGFKPAEKLKTGSVMDILGKPGSGFKPAEQLKKGSVMDILGNSGSGFKPAEKLKQGSVMDILGGNTGKTTQDTSTSDLMQKFRPEAGTWTCDSCLLQNKADTSQCVACQTPKPTEAQATSTTGLAPEPKSAGTSTTGLAPEPKSATTSTTGLAPEPKSAGTSTTGLAPESKSAAASTTGLVPTQSASASTTSLVAESTPGTATTNDLAAMFKPASGSWSCDSCLLQNKADAAACVACQTPNPAKKEPAKKAVKKTWTCDVCLVPNEENVTVCVACQTAKPAKPFSHPPGDWSCDTCTFTNRATDIRCCNCEYIRPGPPRTQTVPGCVKTFLDDRHSKMESLTTAAGLSNSTGFKLSSGVTSSSASVNSLTTGGFKFDSSKISGSGSTLGSGFKFGSSAVNNDSQSAGTGFKLANTSVSESQSLGSGFKFGSTPVSSSNSQSVGGFKFGNGSISVTSQSTPVNFQIGNTALTSTMGSTTTESTFKLNSASVFSSGDTQSKGLNFQFGGTPSTASNLFANPVLTSSVVSSQKPAEASSSFGSVSSSSSGAFIFEPKTTGEKEPFKGTTLSVPGGFNFNTSVSSAISTAMSSSQTGFTSIGGFNFSAAKTNTFTVNSVQASVCTTSPIGGFTFATKMPTAEGTQSTSASEPPKPAENAAQGFAGGFNSAQTHAGTVSAPQQPKPAENATPGFTPGGFVFNPTQTEPPKPSFANFGSAPKPTENATPAFGGFMNKPSASEPPKPTAFGGFSSAQGPSLSFGQPSPKRSADEDSGEQSAKKPAGFNFTTGSSGPLPGTSNGVFAFGAQITTSASPAPASGPFVFGARPADGPAPGAPAPTFNFGQAPNMSFTAAAAPGSFAFSATPTTGDSSRKIKKAVRRIKR